VKYALWFPRLEVGGGHHMVEYFMDETPKDAGPYLRVFEGDINTNNVDLLNNPIARVLESIWKRHNIGDDGDENRPRAQEIRSMCAGDIVQIDGEFWTPEMVGWKQLAAQDLPEFSNT
jgi:hypothetical protein